MTKPGRPPRRPNGNNPSTLTIRLTAPTKNLLIDQAEATDLTVTEYLTSLIHRDAGTTPTQQP